MTSVQEQKYMVCPDCDETHPIDEVCECGYEPDPLICKNPDCGERMRYCKHIEKPVCVANNECECTCQTSDECVSCTDPFWKIYACVYCVVFENGKDFPNYDIENFAETLEGSAGLFLQVYDTGLKDGQDCKFGEEPAFNHPDYPNIGRLYTLGYHEGLRLRSA